MKKCSYLFIATLLLSNPILSLAVGTLDGNDGAGMTVESAEQALLETNQSEDYQESAGTVTELSESLTLESVATESSPETNIEEPKGDPELQAIYDDAMADPFLKQYLTNLEVGNLGEAPTLEEMQHAEYVNLMLYGGWTLNEWDPIIPGNVVDPETPVGANAEAVSMSFVMYFKNFDFVKLFNKDATISINYMNPAEPDLMYLKQSNFTEVLANRVSSITFGSMGRSLGFDLSEYGFKDVLIEGGQFNVNSLGTKFELAVDRDNYKDITMSTENLLFKDIYGNLPTTYSFSPGLTQSAVDPEPETGYTKSIIRLYEHPTRGLVWGVPVDEGNVSAQYGTVPVDAPYIADYQVWTGVNEIGQKILEPFDQDSKKTIHFELQEKDGKEVSYLDIAKHFNGNSLFSYGGNRNTFQNILYSYASEYFEDGHFLSMLFTQPAFSFAIDQTPIEPAGQPITVKYVDENGDELQASTKITGVKGDKKNN